MNGPVPMPPGKPAHLSPVTRIVEANLPPHAPRDAYVGIVDGVMVIAVRAGLDHKARKAAVRGALAEFRRQELVVPVLAAEWLRHGGGAVAGAAAAGLTAVTAAVVVSTPAVAPHVNAAVPSARPPAAVRVHEPSAPRPPPAGHKITASPPPGRTHAHRAAPAPTRRVPSPGASVSPSPSPGPSRSPSPRPSPSPTHFGSLKACLKVYSLAVCLKLGL